MVEEVEDCLGCILSEILVIEEDSPCIVYCDHPKGTKNPMNWSDALSGKIAEDCPLKENSLEVKLKLK